MIFKGGVSMFKKAGPYLRKKRMELKQNMTEEESHMWYDFFQVWKERGGPDFTHQEIINDEYIVDFCCDELKLVVEIDGFQHCSPEGIEKDRIRTKRLEGLGLMVIRYTNKEIHENYKGVCQDIMRIAWIRSGK